MQRLVPAIIEAWRDAEREFDALPEGPERQAMAQRIHILQEAHALAMQDGASREDVVRLLQEHDLGAVVPG